MTRKITEIFHVVVVVGRSEKSRRKDFPLVSSIRGSRAGCGARRARRGEGEGGKKRDRVLSSR